MCFRVKYKWVVLWSLWAARLVRQPSAPLRVAGGLLRGSVAHDGSHIYYLSIPYASVTHRFQGPAPPVQWPGILEAVDENIRCPQKLVHGRNIIIGQEDCLTLNVFTPAVTAPHRSLPVMVLIHGGGFFEGSSSRFLYGPEYLVMKGVVFVSFNYRINVEGFLCLGIKEAPGNAGMKDQIAALKWVKENISAFGGDPDNVTIFGESAGAASVSYHLVSLASRGLFHKAIAQSGSSIAPWSLQRDPIKTASSIAKSLGYSTDDPREIYDLFMSKPASELINVVVPREKGNTFMSQVVQLPCVEQNIDGVESFLTDFPYNIYVNGGFNRVPMIIGANDEEGYFFSNFENSSTLREIDFKTSMPTDLEFQSDAEKTEAAAKVKQMYMGTEDVSTETVLKFSRFLGEIFFNYPALEETQLILKSSKQPVYHYLFKYDGWRNLVKRTLGPKLALAPGASHADDLLYIFAPCMLPRLFENKMIERMTTMWTNFAKFGNPTPGQSEHAGVRWERVLPARARARALVIDGDLSTQRLWHRDTLTYWRRLYHKHRRYETTLFNTTSN